MQGKVALVLDFDIEEVWRDILLESLGADEGGLGRQGQLHPPTHKGAAHLWLSPLPLCLSIPPPLWPSRSPSLTTFASLPLLCHCFQGFCGCVVGVWFFTCLVSSTQD